MNNLTRRRFLSMVGAAGGASAVYNTGLAMGLVRDTGPVAMLDLKPAGPRPEKIAVLGAGVAGLAIAYELERAGYDCTILEASHRVGGRILTLRHGDIVDEMGYNQVCKFDDDPELFFNAGAARIPGHHRRTMRYCRELEVPLQVKANLNRTAYVHEPDSFDGKPIRLAEYISDARGFLSELLYKAVDKNAFDQPLSADDRERLMELAKSYGDLTENGEYRGTRRSGYASGGFMAEGEIREPMEMGALLDSEFWRGSLSNTENYDWAEPLLEVVGGMDIIVRAFERSLKEPVVLNAQVTGIELRDAGVDVYYNHEGKRKKLAADYCFNSIPSHFIEGIPNNFSRDYRAAINALRRGNFFKIGLQMKERFWEREGIYGGITYTNQRINQIWYPSHGIHHRKGIVLGAYAFWHQSHFFERMTPEERLKYAADCGEKVHPGYSSYIEAGVSVPWGRMNHMMGCGNQMSPEDMDQHFERLRAPEAGRHYMVGDQISYHSSWQEGAFASAEFALLDFDDRVRAAPAVSAKG